MKRRHSNSDHSSSAAVEASEPQFPSTSKPEAEVKLPADLWARVLHFAYLDDVLALTQVSKFFLDDVPPQLKYLLVRTGKSMDIMPAAIERFSSVEDVFIYSLVKEIDFPDDANEVEVEVVLHLDSVTVETAARFLEHIPKLHFCYLGGLSQSYDLRGWLNEFRADELTYCTNDIYDTPDHKHKMRQLIESVCQAYADGNLSESITFRGLLPPQWQWTCCCWRNMPQLSSYRGDVNCQVCDMVCMTLPPLQVMRLHCSTGDKAPCISRENRFRIAKLRDRNNFQSNLTQFLVRELSKRCRQLVMCPPDYVQQGGADSYSEEEFAEFQYLISKGANVKDNKVRLALIEYEVDSYHDDDYVQSINNKRILTLETYNRLREIGFDIHENDFALIDTSDVRTNYKLHLGGVE